MKQGDILVLLTEWQVGNGGPDTATIPEGMQFEVMDIQQHTIELTCCNDDYPYDGFKMIILHDDLDDFGPGD